MNSIELFAGIGGISLAAEWAGIETKAFCEIVPFNQKVLNKNFPDVPIFEDVMKLNKRVLEEGGVNVGTIELITGGFPCQPYSIAGNQQGKDDDRDLWPEMFRIVEEIQPRWVVGENVANFVNMELDRTLLDLESAGYDGKSFVVPASAVGANHERYRVFIVAVKKEFLRNANSQPKFQTDSTFGSIRSEWETWNDFTWQHRGIPSGSHWETHQPSVCRMDDGIPSELDKSRLIALGNAVVPQQIYPIFKAIVDIETGRKKQQEDDE
ncbi:DNA cytosine methyltransferase [Terribacillus saccharophilus]|uniref:DNA cytosine methyltransferase n=1 Tax=Terribacillus saccharophilus TaxID=361277 RepID=UPI002DCD355C|nr:DNA (cytosine-5-)-methyltransferase [Terribacillus saccharophilus]MEC0288937.1 DNA (cytosine-5-)-methyltransferase [Terribacillus saccharophilus]